MGKKLNSLRKKVKNLERQMMQIIKEFAPGLLAKPRKGKKAKKGKSKPVKTAKKKSGAAPKNRAVKIVPPMEAPPVPAENM